MTLPDRATVQAAGRPQLQEALDRQGVDVLIRRPGQQDVPTRALLVPVTANAREGAKVDAPVVGTLPWKAFFRHDEVAVQTPGFSLVVLPGRRVLTPTTPAVDLADQGVALMVLATPLADRTRVSALTFLLPGEGLVKDGRGNPVPAPGQPLDVPARLTATTDPRIRETVGADQAEIVLIGRWGTLEHPQGRPAGVGWGSRSPLELDGQPGTLTLKLAWPDEDLATETQFGSRFLAIWRTP